MRKIEIKETVPPIVYEGTQYLPGIWLVSSLFVIHEPDYFVFYEDGERIEAEAAGVMSEQTADALLHNWPDSVFDCEVEEAKAKAETEAKAKAETEAKPKSKRKSNAAAKK